MTLAISALGITKDFGEGAGRTTILRGIDFVVAPGEFVYLVGPSGSGKTTFLSILGCVLRPTKGSLSLYGEEMASRSERDLPRVRRGYLGFVFQGHNLISSLTAEENVLFQLEMRGIGGALARAQAISLLDRVGLGARRHHLPQALSGGQRQRVAIARALAGSPPIILADEPTASLDAESGLEVVTLLKELAVERGHTVVVVTHDSRIFDLADRIEHLEDGRMVPRTEASIPVIRVEHFR